MFPFCRDRPTAPRSPHTQCPYQRSSHVRARRARSQTASTSFDEEAARPFANPRRQSGGAEQSHACKPSPIEARPHPPIMSHDQDPKSIDHATSTATESELVPHPATHTGSTSSMMVDDARLMRHPSRQHVGSSRGAQTEVRATGSWRYNG